jgi:hypothetical protein
MSNFLVNLVRRGAGLPATKIQAPPPWPFGAEAREHGDEFAEKPRADGGPRVAKELATGDSASQALSRPRFADEIMALPSEPPVHASSIQRLSEPERGKPVRPSIGKPAVTITTPSLGPLPSPRQHVTPHLRETEAGPAEPPNHLDPAVPPVHTDREVTTEMDVERTRRTTLPVAQENEPVGETASHAVSVVPGIPILVTKPDKRQLVSTAERPQLSAQETRASALPAPTIRPAPAESHSLLQFPKVAPASSLTPPSQLPIHVRIGRVEVRATTAPAPTPPGPGSPAPLGFDGYYRVRNYRG